jgi:hypothetical protein
MAGYEAYQVRDARTDRVGPMIVVRLPTTDGIPLLIAMDHTVADKLMLGLEQELARLAAVTPRWADRASSTTNLRASRLKAAGGEPRCAV